MSPESAYHRPASHTHAVKKVGAMERLVRYVWGLPTGRGFWSDHPSVGDGSWFCNPQRSPGYHAVRNGNTVMMETATWEDAREASGRVGRVPPTRHETSEESETETNPLRERKESDFWLHDHTRVEYSLRSMAPEGYDDALLSLSLGEDIWHVLTVDMSLRTLLFLEVFVEFAFIFVGSAALVFAAAAEGTAVDTDLLSQKLMLAFTTVRISSDAIFGWEARTPSTKPEIFILALIGWFHWLLLSVAGSIIVARALRPLRQVVFAPDCVCRFGGDNSDVEISVRMLILRHRTVMLYDLRPTLMATVNGVRLNLPLARGVQSYNEVLGMPLTFKHDPSSPDSPLKDMNPQKVSQIAITVTAVDGSGNPVISSATYWNTKSFIAKKRAFQKIFTEHSPPPRMLHGRWADQIRQFRLPNTGEAYEAQGPPVFLYNMDNFHVIVPEESDAEKA